VRIAVDLLGGDHAPAVVVDGALRSCGTDPDLHLVLVGDHPAADEVMRRVDDAMRDRIELRYAARAVAMCDAAIAGADPRTSIAVCMAELAAGRVDAVVSAGQTGATVAAAVTTTGRTPGIRRPALAAILPGLPERTYPTVLLDVGAGVQATPSDLVQHATLGVAYARRAAEVVMPRVGLVSVGAEAGKGDPLRRLTDSALRDRPPAGATYVGPVEGNDVVAGTRADVFVTDGFTGNVLLKGIEAAVAVGAGAYPPAAVPRAAALLGVAGTVVVCHGAADGADLASGIALAVQLVRRDVVAGINPEPAGSSDRGRGHGRDTAQLARSAEVGT